VFLQGVDHEPDLGGLGWICPRELLGFARVMIGVVRTGSGHTLGSPWECRFDAADHLRALSPLAATRVT